MTDKVATNVLKRFLRRQEEIRGWISDFLGDPVPEDPDEFRKYLCDGSVLLHLVKAIDPQSAALPTRNKMKAGAHFENIVNFLKACEYVGVRKDELFSVPDLIDNHDWPKVIYCLQALADFARRRNFEVEMKQIDDAAIEPVAEAKAQRLIEVLESAGGLGAAAKLDKIEAAEHVFHQTHEVGGAIATMAQGLANAMLSNIPQKKQVQKAAKVVKIKVEEVATAAKTVVENFDARDALPPAWISAYFFIFLFSYILYHKFMNPIAY